MEYWAPPLSVAGRREGDLHDRRRPDIGSTLDHPTIGPVCGEYNNNEPGPRDTPRTHPVCFGQFHNFRNARRRHSCNYTRGHFKLDIISIWFFWVNLCDQRSWDMQSEDLGKSTLDVARDSRCAFMGSQELPR